MFSAGNAYATPLTEGSILPGYAVVSVGPNASVTVNSGPINGKVLLGDGSNSSSSGGGNGAVPAGVFVSGTEHSGSDNLQGLQTKPTVTTLSASVGTQAFSDAMALSIAATTAGLTPTLTYTGSVSGALAITGNGGQEVIDFDSLQNPDITITGNASDTFIFNVTGSLNTNHAMVLSGVNASQILWNFTGTSGNIFQTSGGDVLYGTFLATDGGDFQFSNLDLDGQLINTDGHMQIVSGSTIPTDAPFSPPVPVPEPMTLSLFGAGLAGALSMRRRRKI
jgi:hypothetical protein